MHTITIPIIVEGRYDKARVAQVVHGTILTTEGFGIFKNEEKRALIRRLSASGIILLCDSDGAGKVIRGHLKGLVESGKVYDLYVPQVRGVERRKRRTGGSKEGFLGVEGIDNGTLAALFDRFAAAHPECVADVSADAPEREPITKVTLFELGLTGAPDSASLRDRVCLRLGLPAGMTPNAFLAAVGLLYSPSALRDVLLAEEGFDLPAESRR